MLLFGLGSMQFTSVAIFILWHQFVSPTCLSYHGPLLGLHRYLMGTRFQTEKGVGSGFIVSARWASHLLLLRFVSIFLIEDICLFLQYIIQIVFSLKKRYHFIVTVVK